MRKKRSQRWDTREKGAASVVQGEQRGATTEEMSACCGACGAKRAWCERRGANDGKREKRARPPLADRQAVFLGSWGHVVRATALFFGHAAPLSLKVARRALGRLFFRTTLSLLCTPLNTRSSLPSLHRAALLAPRWPRPFLSFPIVGPSSFAPRSLCTTLNTRSSLPSLHHAALLAPRCSPCTTLSLHPARLAPRSPRTPRASRQQQQQKCVNGTGAKACGALPIVRARTTILMCHVHGAARKQCLSRRRHVLPKAVITKSCEHDKKRHMQTQRKQSASKSITAHHQQGFRQ